MYYLNIGIVYFSFFGVILEGPTGNLKVPIYCELLEHWNGIFFLFGGHSTRGPMGKFGSPHKLCIHWIIGMVYFSFLGIILRGPNG